MPVVEPSAVAGNDPAGMEGAQPAVGAGKVQTAVKATPGVVTGTPENKLTAAAVIGMGLKALFFCYLFGVLVFGGNFLLQVAVLLYQSYARPVIRDGRSASWRSAATVRPVLLAIPSLSTPRVMTGRPTTRSLSMKKVHVSGRHTLDILLAEMAVVLQWFNPFAWLYRREVENNLEFLTDASVLEHREWSDRSIN